MLDQGGSRQQQNLQERWYVTPETGLQKALQLLCGVHSLPHVPHCGGSYLPHPDGAHAACGGAHAMRSGAGVL